MADYSYRHYLKGPVRMAVSSASATTTSDEIDITGFNAALVSVDISGTGAWTVKLQGRLGAGTAAKDIYDLNDNQLSTGSLTAGRTKLFAALPDLIRVVATEDTDGAVCTVKIQPVNI